MRYRLFPSKKEKKMEGTCAGLEVVLTPPHLFHRNIISCPTPPPWCGFRLLLMLKSEKPKNVFDVLIWPCCSRHLFPFKIRNELLSINWLVYSAWWCRTKYGHNKSGALHYSTFFSTQTRTSSDGEYNEMLQSICALLSIDCSHSYPMKNLLVHTKNEKKWRDTSLQQEQFRTLQKQVEKKI